MFFRKGVGVCALCVFTHFNFTISDQYGSVCLLDLESICRPLIYITVLVKPFDKPSKIFQFDCG